MYSVHEIFMLCKKSVNSFIKKRKVFGEKNGVM